MTKRIFIISAVLSVLLSVTSCIDRLYGFDTEIPTGVILTPEMIESMIDAATVTEAEKYPTETDSNGSLIVYWLPGGSVWHASIKCSSVEKSDPAKVRSGTISVAIAEGKDRSCKICAEDIEYFDVTVSESSTQTEFETSTDKDTNPGEYEYSKKTVFWTKNGSVWHVNIACSSLANTDPDNLISGSEEDALAAGKERVCKKCSQ